MTGDTNDESDSTDDDLPSISPEEIPEDVEALQCGVVLNADGEQIARLDPDEKGETW